MNTTFLNTLNTTLVITKEDIILALTEGEVDGWKKSMRKNDLMEVLLKALDEAEAMNTKEDIMEAEIKVNTINPLEAHVEAEAHVRGIEDIEADMKYHYEMGNACIVDLAHDFYEAYISKAYEGHYGTIDEEGVSHPCKSFKSYINDFKGGKLYGVSYGMAMHYVNVHKHVMPHRPNIFRYFTIRVLIALVPYMKDEEKRGEVLHMVDNFSITSDMNLEEVKEVLEAMFSDTEAEEVDGTEGEAEAEVDTEEDEDNKYAVSDERIDEALDNLYEFLCNNAHDASLDVDYLIIRKALDR